MNYRTAELPLHIWIFVSTGVTDLKCWGHTDWMINEFEWSILYLRPVCYRRLQLQNHLPWKMKTVVSQMTITMHKKKIYPNLWRTGMIHDFCRNFYRSLSYQHVKLCQRIFSKCAYYCWHSLDAICNEDVSLLMSALKKKSVSLQATFFYTLHHRCVLESSSLWFLFYFVQPPTTRALPSDLWQIHPHYILKHYHATGDVFVEGVRKTLSSCGCE